MTRVASYDGPAVPGPGARLYFIDWLRILAVLLLFPFHTLRVFNAADPFYVKASPESSVVTHVLSFISVWHMPLLFFLAGCSTYFALGKRSGGGYAWERAKRLLVPFVFGFLILIPPQTWFGGRFNSGYSQSYGHYLISGDFLRWNVRDGGDYFGGFGIGQLWFILFLLIISLVVLPLVVWGVRGRGAGRMRSFSRRLSRPVWWLLPVVILLVASAAPEIPGGNIVYYLAVFLLGYVSVCHGSFVESARRYRVPALVVGLGLSLLWVLTAGLRDSLADPSAALVGLNFLGVAAVWLSIVGFLGFGKRYLDRTSPMQRYLAEASYPVYILHQTVIVVMAFYLVGMDIPRVAQWVLLFVAVVLATFALYEIVRRVNPLRFLFGMRPRRRPAAPIEPQAVVIETTRRG
jgi:glucans biosynthesis protein C